jgi:signal peptidase I
MRPTLDVNDRIVPHVVTPGSLRPGVVVVFKTPTEVRVDRIAAVGGDTIALQSGVVVLNGKPVPEQASGDGPTIDGTPTQIMRERFPGEPRWHRMLDAGRSGQDDMLPLRLAPNTLFLLGDDRDFAADSRFPPDEDGAGLVPVSDVIGIVDTVMWSKHRSRIGRPLDDADVEKAMAK